MKIIILKNIIFTYSFVDGLEFLVDNIKLYNEKPVVLDSRITETDIPAFLQEQGIPENTSFSVRFLSDLPLVISHKDHAPAYRSSVI